MNNDGGFAFPSNYIEQHGEHEGIQMVAGGMTLRDWFAGMALSGMNMSDPDLSFEKSSEWAYKQADVMIAQREKETK
jgi:hypothetical protein